MDKIVLPPQPPDHVNNLNNNIYNLPQDIKTHIYKNHLWFDVEKKHICDEVLKWFQKSEQAQRLSLNQEIVKNVESLLKNKTCVEYLRQRDNEFDKCYIDHFIYEKEGFVLMPRLQSFVLSILMYKYH